MQRLSLAELKAKANILSNTEFITGGVEDGCHGATSGSTTITVDQGCREPGTVTPPLPTIPLRPI